MPPYIPTDSAASVAKPLARDTSVHFEWCKKQSLSCLQSVSARGAKAYIVQVTLARDKMPQPQEAQNLIGRVAKVLKKL